SATYIPREPRYGRAGLIDVLKYFAKLQKDDSKKLEVAAKKVQKALEMLNSRDTRVKTKPPLSISDDFVSGVLANYDSEYCGIGMIPKFPHATTIHTLLSIYELDGNKVALKMADEMLEAMAKGGIYDQIEGGFFRYSTDEKWMIPHYEKMLYTNAELLSDYIKAYKITKKPLYKRVVKELVDFISKRFEKDGVFYSASDADSFDVKSGKKEEGAYFVYSYKEALRALEKEGIKESKSVLKYLGITKKGNFEGKNNPYICDECEKPKELKKAKEALLKIREKREYPFVDKKILTSWNALYIKALFEASFIDGSYAKSAKNSLDRLLELIYRDERLYHQVLLGKKAKVPAELEDYSFLIDALIEAYQNSFDTKYLNLADKLTKEAKDIFYKDGVWYESLQPFRVKATLESSSYVSSLGVMADDFLKLAVLTDELEYQKSAKEILTGDLALVSKYPSNFPKAVEEYLAFKNGYIVIKAKTPLIEDIKKEVTKKLSYPFVLYKATHDKDIIACKVDSCFAYANSIDDIIKKLKKR
ncbi:MAG: thioredoxin domain-containing protein, partial [Epsilonproteobacteria bacterium]|nr:thioredoxin domain-containing protein [Campylobacterota bacterium]